MSAATTPGEHTTHRVWVSVTVMSAQSLGFLALTALLIADPETRDFATTNLVVQLVMVLLLGCLPAYRLGLMTAVDVFWPWGLVAIGVLVVGYGDLSSPVVILLALAYGFMGGRMGVWGIRILLRDWPPSEDLARYRYRRLVWRREGYQGETWPMQHEILQQSLGNTSVLALPAALLIADPDPRLGTVAIIAILCWALSWALESLADWQKGRFAADCERRGVRASCTVGLWRFSRHPNYFFQWMQWNAFGVLAVPSLLARQDSLSAPVFALTLVGLLGIPALMYYVLVHFTGAKPAEHFSVQSRPDYREYQRTTNRFFPGPSRS